MNKTARFFLFSLLFGFVGLIFVISLFVLVYDLNPFRTAIEKHLFKQYNIQAKIGYLSIQWEDYLGLSISGLILRHGADNRLLMSTEKIDMSVDIKELFRRRLVIKALDIQKPEIFINRQAETKTWNWPEVFRLNLISGFIDAPDDFESASVKGRWDIDAHEIIFRSARICFQDGISFSYIGEPCIEAVDLKADAPKDESGFNLNAQWKLDVDDPHYFVLEAVYKPSQGIAFDLSYGNRTVEMKGTSGYPFKDAKIAGDIDIHQLNLKELPGSRLNLDNALEGILTSRVSFEASWSWGKPFQNLKYQGEGDLRQGMLKWVNLPKLALNQTNLLPELISVKLSGLPEKYENLFSSEITNFDRAEFSVKGTSSEMNFPEIHLAAENYLLKAQSQVSFNDHSTLIAEIRFLFLEDLSADLLLAFPEWSRFRNRQGRLSFPISIEKEIL